MNNSQTLTQRALAAHHEAEAARRADHQERVLQAKRLRREQIEKAKTLAIGFVRTHINAEVDADTIEVEIGDANHLTKVTFTAEGVPLLCHVNVHDEHEIFRLFYDNQPVHNLAELGKLLEE